MLVQVPSDEAIDYYLKKYCEPRPNGINPHKGERDEWDLYNQGIGFRDACFYFFGTSHTVAFSCAEEDFFNERGCGYEALEAEQAGRGQG